MAVTQASSAIPTGDPTTPLPVSRAGGVLDPSAAAEANAVDNTAVKAFSSVALKDASGQCLFIDPTAGDFRENLIPITLQTCDGSQNQAWDIVTSGKHNNVAGSALVVSSLVSHSHDALHRKSLIIPRRLMDVLTSTRDELLVIQSLCFLVEEELMAVCLLAIAR